MNGNKIKVLCVLWVSLGATQVLGVSVFPVRLYVDSAPNAYGSPDWVPWWNETKSQVAGGTFVNLSHGTYPGTMTIDPYDQIVYFTGDRGRRLHWIYWIPGFTINQLTGNFEMKYVIDWQGTDYTFDWSSGQLVEDDDALGWFPATTWTNYDGAVIGNFGHAWLVDDDYARPYDTNGQPYDQTDQEDIDAMRRLVLGAQTYATGLVRWRNGPGEAWMSSSLTVTIVPLPLAWAGGLPLACGLFLVRLARVRKS